MRIVDKLNYLLLGVFITACVFGVIYLVFGNKTESTIKHGENSIVSTTPIPGNIESEIITVKHDGHELMILCNPYSHGVFMIHHPSCKICTK